MRPWRPRRSDAYGAQITGQLELFALHRGLRATPPTRPPVPAWDPEGPRAVTARHARLKLHVFWVLEAVAEHGRARRWSPILQARTRVTMISALNGRPAGSTLTRADLVASGGPAAALMPVLTELGLLQDPAPDPLVAMTRRRTHGMPDGMGRDLADWMAVLRDGGTRTKPKTWKTTLEYSRWVRPLLLQWGRFHQHLREITTEQVQRALAGVAAGSQRQGTFVALRALFRFLHRDRRIFTNPTRGLSLGARPAPPVLPLSTADYQRVAAHATTELHRVVLVLAAVHGARPHQIRALLRSDVDLNQRCLTVAGVRRDLDDFSAAAITNWVRHRQQTWPLTSNRHLLVGQYTAHDDRPLSRTALAGLFQGTGISLDRLRVDRQLEEALTYGPDPLHLARTSASAQPPACATPTTPNGYSHPEQTQAHDRAARKHP